MHIRDIRSFLRIALLGYGLEGQATERWLQKQVPTIPIKIIERIDTPLESVEAETLYIISPGISRQKICQHIPLNQQSSGAEIFFENIPESLRQKIIGVSGSKGKTTTTKFTHAFLKNMGFNTLIGGNYGIPLLDLYEALDEADFLVAELSSYQLERLTISPYYSIFLNFFTDHVARHGTLSDYWLAKKNLWFGSRNPSKILFIPKNFVSVDKNFSKKLIVDGLGLIKVDESLPLQAHFFPDDSVFRSPHFLQNFGCSVSLVQYLAADKNISLSLFETALATTAKFFKGEPHRLELFASHDGLQFYDDSIATNIFSAQAVIEYFTTNLGALILGGRSESGEEGDDWEFLLKTLQKRAPEAYLWLPESETLPLIELAVKKTLFPSDKVVKGQSFSDLLSRGIPFLSKNKTVVLSPAAKSFDRFETFRERGFAWKQSVEDYYTKSFK